MQKRKKNTGAKSVRKSDWNPTKIKDVVYTSLPAVPAELDTIVRTCGHVKNTSATASISLNFNVNSLLQSVSSPWSSVGQSTSVANVAKNYTSYRVTKYAMKIRMISNVSSPVWVCFLNVPEDPAFSSAVSFLVSSGSYPHSQILMLPGTSNVPNVLSARLSHKIQDIVAQSTVYTDEDYAGAISTAGVFSDPAKLVYCIFYQGLISGAAFTAGQAPTFEVELTQWVRFYERRI